MAVVFLSLLKGAARFSALHITLNHTLEPTACTQPDHVSRVR
jgi:hypothetical protein